MILIAATVVAAIVAAGARPHTTTSLLAQALIQLRQGCSIGVCFVASNAKRKKKRKKFWLHPMTSQRLLKGKFYSLYEDLKAHPQKFFRYFRMSSATFDKLMVLLGPSLTFQDTRMRKSLPPEERLAVTLR